MIHHCQLYVNVLENVIFGNLFQIWSQRICLFLRILNVTSDDRALIKRGLDIIKGIINRWHIVIMQIVYDPVIFRYILALSSLAFVFSPL